MTTKIGHKGNDLLDDYFNYTLRNARVRAGYRGEDLAKIVGVSASSINSYERMRMFPSGEVAKRIALALDRSVEELFPECLRDDICSIRQNRYRDSEDALEHAVPRNLENIESDSLDEPVNYLIANELGENVRKVLGSLDYRTGEIVKLSYGLGYDRSYKLREIGFIFKITPERVRQIEASGIRKLQQPHLAGKLIGLLD